MDPKPNNAVWLILPAHNRRRITLRCLDHLRQTGVLLMARPIVVDDGSSDGTGEAVRAKFPEATVLTGDGNLYWTGAIRMGMRHALEQGAQCCVWLNDDSHPVPGAVERVVKTALEITGICAGFGRFVGIKDGHTFTALYRARWGFRSVGIDAATQAATLAVDACRGNLVAVPRAVVERIGYPDAENLPHYYADTDYTLRATAVGFPCVIDPLAVIEEMEHSGDYDVPWLTTRRPLREIWLRFGKPQAGVYWRANWVYLRRHWGSWRGTLLFAGPYVRLALISILRAVIPLNWIRRIAVGKIVDTHLPEA